MAIRYDDIGDRLKAFRLGSGLSAEEAQAFRSALAEGTAERTAFVSIPFHCAAGTKPA